jgi:hypothetical protein
MDGVFRRDTDEAFDYCHAQPAPIEEIPPHSPIMAFYAYWQRLGGADRLPGRRDIDPADIPKIVSWLILIDVLFDGILDFRYRLVGTSVNRLVGKDVTGLTPWQAFPPNVAETVQRHYRVSVSERRPTIWRTGRPLRDPRSTDCLRAVFPLAADGRNVDMLAALLVPRSAVVY